MRRHRVVLICALLSLLMAVCCRSAGDRPSSRILVISSRQQGVPWTYRMMASLEATLLQAHDAELQIDFMHTSRFVPGHAYFRRRSALYAYEFRQYKFDAIVSVGEDALAYMRADGRRVFNGAPVIFCGVSAASGQTVERLFRGAISSVDSSLDDNIALVSRLCPSVHKLVFVHDQTSEGRAIADEARRLESRFPTLQFAFLTNVSMADLLVHIRRLRRGAALIILPFTIDKTGEFYPQDTAISRMTSASPVPTFGLWSFEMKDGLTGGMLIDEDEYGRSVARAALRLAAGKRISPASISRVRASRYVFDCAKLRKFGIDPSRLPKGSLLINKPPGLIARYHRAFLAMIIVLGCLLAISSAAAYCTYRRKRTAETILSLEREVNEHKRRFYRETILSVTGDKLLICDPSDVRPYIESAAIDAPVEQSLDLPPARSMLRDFAKAHGLDGEPLVSFLIAAGEAASNAIRHGHNGHLYAGEKDGVLWVAVTDQGHGIDSLLLPRVLLQKGYSTKSSLGMGYTVILEMADRIMLSPDGPGTTIVLFKRLNPPS